MNIIAFITDPVPVRSVLTYLDLASRPPPLSPARAPRRGNRRSRGSADHLGNGDGGLHLDRVESRAPKAKVELYGTGTGTEQIVRVNPRVDERYMTDLALLQLYRDPEPGQVMGAGLRLTHQRP